MPAPAESEPARDGAQRVPALLFAVLAVAAVRLVIGAQVHSLTFDEPVHLAAGLAYWRTGDLGYAREHPPLIPLLAAAPLLATAATADPAPRETDERDPARALAAKNAYADRIVFQNRVDAAVIAHRGRLVMIGLALLFGLVVFAYARSLFGPWAGFLAASLYLFDPNVLAHGQIVKNDLPLAGLVLASSFALHRFRVGGRWRALVLATILFALACGTKLSTLAAAPVFAALVVWLVFARTTGEIRHRLATTLAALVALFLLADLVLNAVYGFQSLHHFHKGIHQLRQNRDVGHAAFLFGQIREHGWWYYFPAALFLKTPPPTLALWALGLALIPRVARRRGWAALAFLLLPPAALFLLAAASHINIGVRHVLFVYPALAVLAGAVAAEDLASRVLRRAAAILALATALISLAAHPDELSYMNTFGGPEAKVRLLGDSNLDWGQDLPRLARWMRENGVARVHLAYFGTDHPGRFGIDAIPLTRPTALGDFRRGEGGSDWVAVSTTLYQRIYGAQDVIASLRALRPEVYLGDTIRLYRLPPPAVKP